MTRTRSPRGFTTVPRFPTPNQEPLVTTTTTRPQAAPVAPRCPACATRCFWFDDEDSGERELVCPNCTAFAANDLEDDD